jgi:serine/threonine protein phosphatase PrpC
VGTRRRFPALRFQKRGIVEQTEDHSVPQALLKAGEITSDQVPVHCDRNRLLRSVGEHGAVQATFLNAPRDLCPGDAFLLCTNGFWEYVYETEMLADLACSSSPEEWLGRARHRILRRPSGEYDNYSAVAIFFSGEPVPPPIPADRSTVSG